MKYLLQLFIFLLPFHAIFVTYLKCKAGIDTDILRFWKEIVISILLAIVSLKILFTNKFNLEKIYKNNYLLGLTTAFVICSFIYIFFPYFNIKTTNLLGFKYDVFFLFAFIIGLYLISIKNNFKSILISNFLSIGVILMIFLPWYMSGNIESTTQIIGFDNTPSTYEANSCISFSQNVTGGHNRFQGSFGDPIRFGVFLVVFYLIFLGFILENTKQNKLNRFFIIGIVSVLIITSIFYSFTKTSMLGFVFGVLTFIYLSRKIIYNKTIPKKILISISSLMALGLVLLVYIKRNLFLHPEAILGRVENLVISVKMFFVNPFGYGLGIAGPASWLSTSSDKAMSAGVNKFLPENWYIQILLEQGILGISLFLGLIIVIGVNLFDIVKRKKDYLSIGIFTSYLALLFMANFTHAFEESATSYILFIIIGGYISLEKQKNKV
ncbi:O-antigen ligase family protein [Candidatus Gracilibacteria bacterium]|nr:O-antigen ligase family protein [Candidatus Gracilibacteria bacterium]